MMDLHDSIEELYILYNEIKDEIRRSHPNFYKSWKAGGFLIDEDIMSMYPCLSSFDSEDEDEEYEED